MLRYSFTTIQADNSAQFRCVVSNTVGSAASNPATLTISFTSNCNSLILGNDGEGSIPVASPAKSVACPSDGQYVAGEAIQLSGAVPDPGSQVGKWEGTNDDVSTADTNSLTMPAGDHVAIVAYVFETTGWVAYNDCVYKPETNYTVPNVTYYDLGTGHTHGSSGLLRDIFTGVNTPATATLTQSGGVYWEAGTAAGGRDPAVGTDAYNTFHNITDLTGVTGYGISGWWVDLTFTGLNPAKTYSFATSASRSEPAHADRNTKFTLSGVVSATNASSPGVGGCTPDTGGYAAVCFNTGDNQANGYVARWTGIRPSGNSIKVRAQAQDPTAQYRAYAFSVFRIEEELGGSPSCYTLTLGRTGNGVNPTASPPKSPSCPANGQYTAGQVIQLSGAAPASGYRIGGWTGTVNNAGATGSNAVVMPAANHQAGVTYIQNCYTLTLSHTGSGSNPTASPAKSASCPANGQYTADETIQLSGAAPASGYQISSWTGTVNDERTTATNQATMPAANHTAGVNYTSVGPPCFSLTLGHTGNGANPIPSPVKSASCPANGQYVADEVIQLGGATPDLGWRIGSWYGTNNNSSTVQTNSVRMPAANLTAGVTYTQICYALTLGHTGNGSNPTASLAKSASCPTNGQYVANESIQLSGATPDSGYRISGWTGTSNNGSTANTNSVRMPAANLTVTVDYALEIAGWVAYNDCAYNPQTNYTAPNVTYYGIGAWVDSPPTDPPSGLLKNKATGATLPVQATFTQSPFTSPSKGVYRAAQPTNGGRDPAAGTDAYNTFHGITDMKGVTGYGNSGWWVELEITNLDPDKTYSFATSANRANSTLTDRITQFTLSGVDSAVNDSTPGIIVINNLSVAFNTGNNQTNGYVARWTGIRPSGTSFKVRAEAHTAQYKAYAFSVFRLEEEPSGPPTCYTLTVGKTGNGSVPTASPIKSASCPSIGQYVAGELIRLNGATPAPGWRIGSWYGTNNDQSTEVSNSVTMPAAAHAAGVNYISENTGWVAYNDVNYRSSDQYTVPNVTYYDIGTGHPHPSSGPLKNKGTGAELPVRVALISNGSILWDPTHGLDTASGTDAYQTFGNITNMRGVISGQSKGWYVDLNFSSLDPNKTYRFATSASRAEPAYTNRNTKFTLYAGSADPPISPIPCSPAPGGNSAVCINTGDNQANGHVARWIKISPKDGGFRVRAEAQDPDTQPLAYAFSVFRLEEEPSGPPTCYTLSVGKTGSGSLPTASPTKSASCDSNGQYVAGELIQLSGAIPDPGWRIGSWYGTNNDPSPEGSNSVTMPAANHAAGVNYVSESAGWVAYNDCVYKSETNYTVPNVTYYDLGTGHAHGSSGLLKDIFTGADTPATVTLTQSGGVYWEAGIAAGGWDPAVGTDAYNTFHNITDLTGVTGYGSSGWWVDLTFTGLNPAKTYSFATSASRSEPAYADRNTKFTLSGVVSANNASSSGVGGCTPDTGGYTAVCFNTGDNQANGYVARWTGIHPSGTSFKVRAQAQNPAAQHKAYAFSVFRLEEEAGSACHRLTLSHTGTGSDPTADPAKSDDCPDVGYYVEGEVIQLSGVAPGSGQRIVGWTGAVKDAATTWTNAVVMPAGAHTATVNYSTDNKFAFLVTTDWHTSIYQTAVLQNLLQIKSWIYNQPPSNMPAPSFMVITGDFPNVSQTQTAMDHVLGPGFLWYPVIGNHEIQDGISNFNTVRDILVPSLPYIVNHGPTGSVNTSYSWNYGNAHFTAVNSHWNGGTGAGADSAHVSGDIVPALRTWIDNDLVAAGQTHKFALVHEPAYPEGRNVGDSLDKYPVNRNNFVDTLNSRGVQTLFTGHTHIYDHKTNVNEPRLGNMHQIINGSFSEAYKSTNPPDSLITSTITYVLVDGNTTTYRVYEKGAGTTVYNLKETWPITR